MDSADKKIGEIPEKRGKIVKAKLQDVIADYCT